MPINWLVGRNSLRSIRDDSRDFARNAYDPSTLNPMRQHAESMANRGIDTDRYRRSALESLSQDPNLEMAGGRAATAMGITSGMDENRAGAISQFESNLMEADLGARERGREQLANVQSQQRSIAGTREAALNQIDANYEAELSARKRTLGVAAVGLGISAAGGMPAIGKAIGGLFGGTPEAPEKPFINMEGFDSQTKEEGLREWLNTQSEFSSWLHSPEFDSKLEMNTLMDLDPNQPDLAKWLHEDIEFNVGGESYTKPPTVEQEATPQTPNRLTTTGLTAVKINEQNKLNDILLEADGSRNIGSEIVDDLRGFKRFLEAYQKRKQRSRTVNQ